MSNKYLEVVTKIWKLVIRRLHKKFNKQKVFLPSFIFLVGLWFNVYFSTGLHFLLTHQAEEFEMVSFKKCMVSMAMSGAHLSLFLCFQGVILLIAVFMYIVNFKPYQSDLVQITPNISTPVPAGQKQFGSAKWLTDKEKEIAFSHYKLDPTDYYFEPILDMNLKELVHIAKWEEKEKVDEQKRTREEVKATEVSRNDKQQQSDKPEQPLKKEQPLKVEQSTKSPPPPKPKDYLKTGGIVLDFKKEANQEQIRFINEDTHMLCIGATRSGKTRTVVLQSVGTIGLSGESLIISDPKGEIYNYTSPFLKQQGYQIICLDFKNPLKSNRYNFLQPIIDAIDQNDIPKAVDATWDLTTSLVPENEHNDKIWTNGEASIIASAIMSVVYDNRNGNDRRFQNMSNVYFFISEMCKTIDGTMPILKYMKSIPASHPAKALLAISEVAPSKTRSSFYASALTTLRLFTNPQIHSMTNVSDFNTDELGDKKQAIFIILPDEKTTYYSLASLFVNQCYMQLVKNADQRGGRLKRRINLMLEEFGNFVKIPDFANKLTVGGGRGIRFNLFIQSISQLDEKYGKETAETIKSNCETWIYLQADDLGTLEEMSKKLGNYTVATYSLSSNHTKFSSPSSSHSINLTHRALLSIDEVRLISRPYALITSRNNPAIVFMPDLSEWFFNKLFGLGDKEHNRKVRAYREQVRPIREQAKQIDTWNIWEFYTQQDKSKYLYMPNMRGGENDD